MEEYRKTIEKVKSNGNWFRQGKTFRTSQYFYFLDTGTGKVYKVNENVFRVLDCLFKTNSFDNLYSINMPKKDIKNALEEICSGIDKQNLFSAPLLTFNNIAGQNLALEDNLTKDMNSITLELTERCNLRCKYCVYSETNNDYRTFGIKDMTFETAQKAIDFLMEHSSEDKRVFIGLYGGEPLLRFPLVKQVIAYVQKRYSQRDVYYSMTSNMTLMTEEIANFLVSIKNMSVVASIDGPEEIHDMQRTYLNGAGSFSDAIRGLNTYIRIKQSSPNKDIPIAFSVVVQAPYTKEKFEKINSFFKPLKLQYPCSVLISYVSTTSTPEEYVPINKRPENIWTDDVEPDYAYDPIDVWTLHNLDTKNFSFDYFRRNALLEIHKRTICDLPINTYPLNGCCVPGARRLYVTTTGDFLPCERVGTQLPLGNVNEGLNIDYIKKHYIDEFIKQEIKYCGECWAINVCNNCYMNCFGAEGMDFSHRHRMCRNTRKRLSESLSIYHEVMTLPPEIINDLNAVVIE